MKSEIKTIYLAGSVPKSDTEIEKFKDWREEYIEKLNEVGNFNFINPNDDRECSENDVFGVFGMGCKHIKSSDLIIVHVDKDKKLGVGTSQEILVAKYFKIPVIIVLPKNSNHRKINLKFRDEEISDWIHPFLYGSSDIIIESIDEISLAFDKLKEMDIKDISVIDKSIDYYLKKYEV